MNFKVIMTDLIELIDGIQKLPISADNLKILLNSGYGVFAQSYPQFTKFTNFIYASYPTRL